MHEPVLDFRVRGLVLFVLLTFRQRFTDLDLTLNVPLLLHLPHQEHDTGLYYEVISLFFDALLHFLIVVLTHHLFFLYLVRHDEVQHLSHFSQRFI